MCSSDLAVQFLGSNEVDETDGHAGTCEMHHLDAVGESIRVQFAIDHACNEFTGGVDPRIDDGARGLERPKAECVPEPQHAADGEGDARSIPAHRVRGDASTALAQPFTPGPLSRGQIRVVDRQCIGQYEWRFGTAREVVTPKSELDRKSTRLNSSH